MFDSRGGGINKQILGIEGLIRVYFIYFIQKCSEESEDELCIDVNSVVNTDPSISDIDSLTTHSAEVSKQGLRTSCFWTLLSLFLQNTCFSNDWQLSP